MRPSRESLAPKPEARPTGAKSHGAGAVPRRPAPQPTRAVRAAVDWVWSGLGIGAATSSAGFAAYMLTFGTGQVVPSGNFNLFASYDHRTLNAARHAPPPTPDPDQAADAPGPRDETARADAADAVDLTPTGSIARPARASDGPSGRSGQGRYASNVAPLPNFTLRNVFDGKALVESRSSLSVVRPGSTLDGAGQVLSIERRNGTWVVLTDRGLIAGQVQ